MEEFKPNSHKARAENNNLAVQKNKVDKVITGEAKVKKRNGVRKLAEIFLSKDIGDLKEYVIFEVIIPAIKRGLWEAGTSGLDMILPGETNRTRKNYVGSKVSWRDYNNPNEHKEPNRHRDRSGYLQNDIILDNRLDAEEALSSMTEIISKYGLVRVADLNELIGITGHHTDNKYGWTDISHADVIRVRDGYMLKLPKALPLD